MCVLTDSIEYRGKAERLCHMHARIGNDLMHSLVAYNNIFLKLTSYTLDTYLNLIEENMDSLSIEFSDFKKEETLLVKSKLEAIGIGANVEYVSCNVKTRGIISLDTRDLIVIRNGRVSLITKY
jgi:hypothetical protein